MHKITALHNAYFRRAGPALFLKPAHAVIGAVTASTLLALAAVIFTDPDGFKNFLMRCAAKIMV